MTTTRTSSPGLSRRGLLAGGLAGAGTLALAACAADDPDATASDAVQVARVRRAPVDDPASETWRSATPTAIAMDAQAIALPYRETPLVPQISVRAVHDGETIAFRLTWSDTGTEDLTVPVDGFRDACAVLLAPGDGDQAVRMMGATSTPATLLQWKADWQRDLEEGIQSVATTFPNGTVDVYMPLVREVPSEVTPADYEAGGVSQWLPGLHVGNPLSGSTRTTCVEKLVAWGYGTAATTATQNAMGRGERSDNGWTVVVAKPMASTDDDELDIHPGRAYTCAFALWAGNEADSGGRKTPSKLAHRLVVAG
jgi:DMSO reductase family type II enzyme heme b subunit